MTEFNPEMFVKERIKVIKDVIGSKKAVIAVSGGVDSSTCAVLTHLAIGKNLVCVILDDAFMRIGEPEKVKELLSQPPLNLPVKIERVQEIFLKALDGLRDAEEKRKAFRKVFYETLSDIAKREESQTMVQGTILADIIETTGGIKTQHNVLEQIGINTRELFGFQIVEPLVTLLKWQVREVARYLKVPSNLSERQPFPGPGLSVRMVGEIRPDKLMILKKTTEIIERILSEHKPSQYFAAILDNKEKLQRPEMKVVVETAAKSLGINKDNVSVKFFEDRATGMRNKERVYGEIVAFSCKGINLDIHQASSKDFQNLQKSVIQENSSVTRVLYLIGERKNWKPYVVTLRAVDTRDYLTAKVSVIPWLTLKKTADRILAACRDVEAVYFDITPKPPATIEME